MKINAITIPALAALLIAASPIISFAQSKIDTSANKDEMMKQRIELSKTGRYHQLLAGVAGNWTFTGKHFLEGPDKPPFEFKGTAVRRSIMDGRYFIFETTGGKLKMPWSDGKEVAYLDMIMEGYDNNKKKFVTAGIANHWDTGIGVTEGSYDSTKKTICYESEIEYASGAIVPVRTYLKILSTDHYTIERYHIVDGKALKRTEANYTRVKDNQAHVQAFTTPGAQHKMLARSNGIWVGEATMWFSPDAPPVNGGSSILTNKMTLDGLYQVSEIIGDTTSGRGRPWTGLRITGYDKERKVFTRAMIGDGASSGGVGMEGPWDEATQSMTMPFKKFDPSTGKERNLKEVYKIIDDNTEVLEIYAYDEKTGKEFRVLNVKWTRQQ